MQETRVRALVRVDPTCHEATKPVRHNYWAHAMQQEKPLQWEARVPQRRVAPRSLQLEKAHAQQRRPNTAKNK